MQITSRSTPDETLTRLCSLRQQKRYLHVRDFVLLVAIHPAVTEMTKSTLSGVRGRGQKLAALWLLRYCSYIFSEKGFLGSTKSASLIVLESESVKQSFLKSTSL